MQKRIRHPLETKPRTVERADRNGRPVFEITPRVMTPLRVKLAEGVGCITTIATILLGAVGLSAVPGLLGHLAFPVALILGAMTGPLQRIAWRHILKKKKQIVISADHFSVKTILGWKHFDRHVEHGFVLYPHEQRTNELMRIEYRKAEAALNRQVYRPVRCYSDSFHLVFEYLGQPIKIVDIFGEEDARKVMNRIIACEKLIEGSRGHGKGTALEAKGDWKRGAGELPGPKREATKALPAPKAKLPQLTYQPVLKMAKTIVAPKD